MKVAFPSVPPIGLAISLDGQRFDLVGVEPYTRRDESETNLLVWRSECATCGEGYTGKSSVDALPGTRRCFEHRAPGKRVARATHNPVLNRDFGEG